MATLTPIAFSIVVSLAPALSMLFGSIVLQKFEVTPHTMAIFQARSCENLSAGLLLAAVASELFPLLAETPGAAGAGGLTVGFAAGLALVFGTEKLGALLEGKDESAASVPQWSPHDARESAVQLLAEDHRAHLQMHLDEFAEAVAHVDAQASALVAPSISVAEEENASEAIDEALHGLQYKLDHCRRLLEGAETGGATRRPALFDKQVLRLRVTEVRTAVSHLQEHMRAADFDGEVVKEMHEHMDEMETILDTFHRTVQSGFSYWRRLAVSLPSAGAKLPIGLVVAVYVDAFVDGFLIGVSCALNKHAGLVLAIANVIEMMFVGAAFSSTVSHCSGVGRRARMAVVCATSVVLVASAAVGGALGNVSRENPAVFTGFVSFGVVALLFLVTHELLIEAHEALKELDVTWINTVFYIGIYLVLLSNRLIPA